MALWRPCQAPSTRPTRPAVATPAPSKTLSRFPSFRAQSSARSNNDKGKPMSKRLAKELFDAARGEGKAVNTREQTHRMAEANKAFSHFAW